jgi:excisionase family DNA binding protein
MIAVINIDGYLVPDAAQYLGLSQDTVRRYASRKVLRVSRKLGNMLVFSQAELDRYQRERRGPGNPTFRKSKPAKQF